jgi:hypothetical protein
VRVRGDAEASQSYVIYRTGRASEPRNPDLYSAKKAVVAGRREARFAERAAFGVIVLAGTGEVKVAGRQGVRAAAASLYPDRDTVLEDELFVAAGAAASFGLTAAGEEPLSFCQHFASGSNPEAGSLAVPEWIPFPEG